MGPEPAVAAVRRAVRELLTTCLTPAPTPASSAAGAGESGIPAREPRVLVACSGGADSLALAAAAAFVAPRLGVAAGLVTVDHGLQPGSSAQAARVAAIGYELGLDPVEVVPVDVPRGGAGRVSGPEAAARVARYAVLGSVAAALDADVLLGHTLDDQAETVLLGLGRGSGPRSIAGMRAVTGRTADGGLWLRPFLGLRRATTAAACAALGLTPWEDPHNADPAFRRVRLRREVLPLLEDVLAGGVAEALARTASLVQDDLDALDALAERWPRCPAGPGGPPACGGASRRNEANGELDVAGLAEQPRAIRSRVLRAWAHRAGATPLTAAHVAALDALVTDWHGQGRVDLPGGVGAVRASGKLVTQALPAEPSPTTGPTPPPAPDPSAPPPLAQEQPRA
jgi:tRNA(Ile)-lysidine synthase